MSFPGFRMTIPYDIKMFQICKDSLDEIIQIFNNGDKF